MVFQELTRLAVRYHQRRNWFFLGRGIYTAIAYESAPKMQEVTYPPAEGMPAGFLEHGTLSLIEEEMPGMFLIPPKEEQEVCDLTFSSLEEVRAHHGTVIACGFDKGGGHCNEMIMLTKTSLGTAPFLHLLVGQLLAYEIAVLCGCDVDKPRNLAKSVTVE